MPGLPAGCGLCLLGMTRFRVQLLHWVSKTQTHSSIGSVWIPKPGQGGKRRGIGKILDQQSLLFPPQCYTNCSALGGKLTHSSSQPVSLSGPKPWLQSIRMLPKSNPALSLFLPFPFFFSLINNGIGKGVCGWVSKSVSHIRMETWVPITSHHIKKLLKI